MAYGNRRRARGWSNRRRSGFPHRPYRPSRVSGNPTVTCQDCGIIRQYRRDSRLRGKDGREGAAGNGAVCLILLRQLPILRRRGRIVRRPPRRNFLLRQAQAADGPLLIRVRYEVGIRRPFQ